MEQIHKKDQTTGLGDIQDVQPLENYLNQFVYEEIFFY